MDVYIAADHRGYQLKNQLAEWLTAQGHSVHDLGAAALVDNDDYPDYGLKVAQAVAEDPATRYGVLVCGSGVGMAVVANKVNGIRASLIQDPAVAEAAQHDDDINVIALGSDHTSLEQAQAIITAWFSTRFSGEERHVRRIGKISQLES